MEDLIELYSDPQVAHWTGQWTPTKVRSWTRGMADRWRKDGIGKWMARTRLEGHLVGRGGLSRVELEGQSVLEVGWVVRDALTGCGYATEMGRAALAWAAVHEPDLPVVAFTEVHNAASRVVMSRLGMRWEREIHRKGLIEGVPGVQPQAPFALYRATR